MLNTNEAADQSNVITLKSLFEHLASSIVKEQNEKENGN